MEYCKISMQIYMFILPEQNPLYECIPWLWKGIDISHHVPMHVETYLKERWDYVITVCDGANETCPVFIGDVRHRLHIGFEDPARNYENQEEERQGFIKIRDKIVLELFRFNARTFKD